MSRKFLGRVVAGAALGGAALLVGAPGIAMAASDGENNVDTVHTPKKIIEICVVELAPRPTKSPTAATPKDADSTEFTRLLEDTGLTVPDKVIKTRKKCKVLIWKDGVVTSADEATKDATSADEATEDATSPTPTVPKDAITPTPVVPEGAAPTGDGGSAGNSIAMLAGGAGVLAAATLGGTALRRRRATYDSLS